MDVKGLSHFSPLCLGNRAWNQCPNPKMAAKLGELLNSLTVWQRQPPFWDTKSRKTVVSKRLGKKKKGKFQLDKPKKLAPGVKSALLFPPCTYNCLFCFTRECILKICFCYAMV